MLSSLTPDVGCGDRQNWRCDVDRAPAADLVEERLGAVGYHTRCRHGALYVFRHREDHEVAWVVTTGRIQIRLAPAVERSRRHKLAQTVYGHLVEAFEAATTSPSKEAPHA